MLLCSATFKAIKHMAPELGEVTQNGVHVDRLKRPIWGWLWRWAQRIHKYGFLPDLGRYHTDGPDPGPDPMVQTRVHILPTACARTFQYDLVTQFLTSPFSSFPCSVFGWRDSKGALQQEAVLLDMGQYMFHRGAGQRTLPIVLTKEQYGESRVNKQQQGGGGASGEEMEDKSTERSAISLTRQPSLARSRLIRVYQVLSPGQAGRAHVFGSALALNTKEWAQIDCPYFDAPGKSIV